MEFKRNFGVRIKELRIKKHLTQAELSELVGIDAKHMSHIETGRSFPKADLIVRLEEALGTTISNMFFFEHMKPRKELLNEITKTLKTLPEKELKVLYKIIVAYTQ